MLEVKNLCKSYKSGDGAIVEATKNISLRFPERGMVFLLGRSGSGKSTLLHLLGGLDRYDSGEILIHHTSTKDFTDAMMDSYRNTYVGYVFQDYNILPEFTVGANIGLAMELQGEKASQERIDELLSLVDLEGLAKRRPNELSGGQLQRVAIARALIKNPDIILADEPTGALDSATGRQVFETFKKLSQEKLVIIVSHDRDYSERYADRIIELADGEVISDVELKPVEELSEIHEIRLSEESGLHFSENGIVAEPWTVITDEDRSVINEYLALQAAGDVLLVDEHTVTPKKGRFQTTSENRIVEEKKEFRLIKSRLPWKRSLGIGVNSMKHKKITLVFTLLLSIAAFTMFGLADVFRSFDRVTCMVDSLRDSGQKYMAIYKQSTDRYASNFDYDLKAEDVEYLKEGLGDRFVATRSLGLGSFVYYDETDHSGIQLDNFARYVYPRFSYNGMELDESACERLGLSLAAGRLPEPGTNEVCVSNLAAEFMVTYGFADLKDCPIEDTIGLTLTNKKNGRKVKIVGIVNTQVDVELYRKMLKPDEELHNDSDWLLFQVYSRNAQFECIYGLPGVLFYAPGSFETKISSNELNSFSVSDESMYLNIGSVGSYKNPAHLYTSIENVPEDSICWFEDGKTELAEGEILISVDTAIAWQFEAVNDGSGMLLSGLEETAEDYRNSDFYRAVMRLPDKYFNVGRDCDSRKFRIVGMYVNEGNRSASAVVMNNGDLKEYEAIMQDPISAIFAPIPDSDSELRKNVAYLNRDRNGARFEIQSRATMGIEEANEIADFMAPALTVIGTVMAIFSAVLFSVFIANSVLRKRQEIGVLRAIGARSLDVYRIFLCEVGLIAAFNWLASVGLTFLFTGRINSGLRRETVIQLTLFHAGKRQVLYIFAIAAVVSIVATFLPVWGIARKKPIDVIRDR